MKTIIVSFEILEKASSDLSKNWNSVVLWSFISVDGRNIYNSWLESLKEKSPWNEQIAS